MFRFASSVVLRGGRGAADRYRCVWVALTVFRPHWLCPAHVCVCCSRLHCSGSRLLYMERALCCVLFQFSGIPQKRGLGCTCVLCLSRPEQLRQPGACPAHSPQVRCAFSPLRPQPQFPPAPVRCVHLVFSRYPPGGCRPSRISGSLWLETGGLFAVW